MTANVPPMKAWAEHHLASIFKAPTQPEFTDAFDAFLSQKATVTVNGRDLSVEQYKNMLQGEKYNQTSASIKFHSAVDVPADSSSVQTGMVGLFYTATISELDIRAAEKDITSSMNLVIGEDKSVEPPGIDPFFDGTAFHHRSLHQGKQQVRFEEAHAAVRFTVFRPHVDGPPFIFNYLHPPSPTSVYRVRLTPSTSARIGTRYIALDWARRTSKISSSPTYVYIGPDPSTSVQAQVDGGVCVPSAHMGRQTLRLLGVGTQ
ncbi:hypothetical protein C8R45DRAFT_1081292 [Mycena sanguinolenta]|nr:hypothetical protein C8R45DRAFT_1081292 [Mycena sanguinolenta]